MDLSLIPTTKALYAPKPGPTFVFLLSDPPQQPPASIPIGDTWAAEGQPQTLGWYVFVLAVPSGADAVKLEQDLRASLDDARGFAWASAPSATFALTAAVTIGLDVVDRPIVAADAPVRLPKGLPELTFGADLGIAALGDPGPLPALGVGEPGRPPAFGLRVELSGPTSGCVSFSALLSSPVEGDLSVKPLAAAQIDPLRPFDPKRTHVTPLGPEYVLSREGSGYWLERASA